MTERTAYAANTRGRPPCPDWAHGPAAAVAASAHGASGVAVALRQGDRRAVVTHGGTAHAGSVPVTDSTRFEVGSLTKCFTALLLAEQAARGEVSHHDPLSRFLPPRGLPRPHGGPITLLHLATHTSGLPRLPPGLLRGAAPRLFSNPYAAFSTDDLLSALARTRPHSRPGDRLRYSNFGAGLLGHLLTRAAAPGGPAYGEPPQDPDGRLYGELLAARVLDPLGLDDTTCAPGPSGATGYRHGRALPPWRIPGLAGAGAVRSSARDLLALLDALLDAPGGSGVPPAALRTALVDVARPRLALPGGDRRLALIWNIRVRRDGDVYHHSGGTLGFTAFAGFSPRHRTALVAVANTGPPAGRAFIQSAYTALLSLARPVSR
ncbi:serine hydrolase domain-containing protein [Streptomyces sp. NPDC051569]|uniref:serine hydrolase domain-containing protein n=1 Tax=Streptomyces sp. NPDC051569 TaxID=3365661 RepID=UPI00378E4EC7